MNFINRQEVEQSVESLTQIQEDVLECRVVLPPHGGKLRGTRLPQFLETRRQSMIDSNRTGRLRLTSRLYVLAARTTEVTYNTGSNIIRHQPDHQP